MGSDAPQISKHPQFESGVVQAKLNGLARIMRYWLRQNRQVANIKLIARPDHYAA